MTGRKNKKVYMTEEGLEIIKEELKVLKLEKRPEIIDAIKEARELGDLAENTDYHSAREEQAFLESKIQELEKIVENAVIIKNGNTNEVGLGAIVILQYDNDINDVEEYKIVGSKEADPSKNKISNESPLAQAIMKRKKGEVVIVESPNGSYEVKIIDIK